MEEVTAIVYPLPRRAVPDRRKKAPRPRGWIQRGGVPWMEHWFGPGGGRKNQAIQCLLDWMHRPFNLLTQVPEVDKNKLTQAYEEWEMSPQTVRRVEFLDVERLRIQIENTQAGLLRYIDIWTPPVIQVLESVPNTCTQTLDQLRSIQWAEERRRRSESRSSPQEDQLLVALPALPPIPERLALPAPSDSTVADQGRVSIVHTESPEQSTGSSPLALVSAGVPVNVTFTREHLENLAFPRYALKVWFGVSQVFGKSPIALLSLPAPPLRLALPAPTFMEMVDEESPLRLTRSQEFIEMSREEDRQGSVSDYKMVELSREEDRPDSSHPLSAGSERDREEAGPGLFGVVVVGMEADFCTVSKSRSLQTGKMDYRLQKSLIESDHSDQNFDNSQLESFEVPRDSLEIRSTTHQVNYDVEAYRTFLDSLPSNLRSSVAEEFEKILTRAGSS